MTCSLAALLLYSKGYGLVKDMVVSCQLSVVSTDPGLRRDDKKEETMAEPLAAGN
jgi:hypothetical protein